ncbi:hypothetical protein Ddye_000771 [Dipteronia dyeriana]|uniref:Transposase MuDR plant domain-containing protein n=1 Tax=Dipteronia dyeriana TaxID=168575 RepID=A0AAD9XMQ5_9ROSI|nr:hypothetical protein Ddye_000771 [Dipteronia dyeriana]
MPDDDYCVWFYLPWSSEKKEMCSDNDNLEVFRWFSEHKQIKIMSEIEKKPDILVVPDVEAFSGTPYRFMSDIPDVGFSGFEQDLFGYNKGNLHYKGDLHNEGDIEDQVGLGDEFVGNEDQVGLGDESGDDKSPGMKALAVVHGVPKDACDEVSDAKPDMVLKSNPFKQLVGCPIRLIWVCMAKGCPWRIHASNFGNDTTIQVKTYKNEHTCHRIYKSKEARSKWIAKKFQDLMKSNHGIQEGVIYDLLRDPFNVVVDT